MRRSLITVSVLFVGLVAAHFVVGCGDNSNPNGTPDLSAQVPADMTTIAANTDLTTSGDLSGASQGDFSQINMTDGPSQSAHCTDGALDSDETDVDCGGATCPGCAAGKRCKVNGDCASAQCTNNVCVGAATLKFATQQTYAADLHPTYVAIGDLNGDGKLDLAIANSQSTTVTVRYNSGTGTFASSTAVGVPNGTTQIAIGDMDKDGKSDLVMANGPVIAIALQNQGGFQSPAQYTANVLATSVALGDFNGDQLLDVVAGDPSSNAVKLFPGVVGGKLGTAKSFSVNNPQLLAVADLNADGFPDVVAPGFGGNVSQLNVLLGAGATPLKAAVGYATGSQPVAVAIADVNGDGKLDLVSCNHPAGTVSVLLGVGDGTFKAQSVVTTGAAPASAALADFDHDGKIDLAVASSNESNVIVQLGAGDGTFGMPVRFATGAAASWVAAADLDGNGRPDLVVANANDNDVSVLLNTTP